MENAGFFQLVAGLMSEKEDKVPGQVRRMEPKPLDDKPRPIVESWVKRVEHKAEAGAVRAHNEMKAALVRNRELDAKVVEADTDLERAKNRHANIDDLKALDKAGIDAELKETENRRDIALAKANEVVADSQARKAEAVAAKANAEADEMEAAVRKEEARLRLQALKRGKPKDDFDELATEAANLREEVEQLTNKINDLLLEDGDTEAQSQRRVLDREKREKEARLAELNRRLDELEGNGG